MAGVNGDEEPPVPIPNTEVKLICADNTWRATAWEDRSMPAPVSDCGHKKENADWRSLFCFAERKRLHFFPLSEQK